MRKELFKKTKYIPLGSYTNPAEETAPTYPQKEESVTETVDKEPAVPDGAWIKCDACGKMLYFEDVQSQFECCVHCNKHFRISAKKRIAMIVDEDTFEEWDEQLETKNLLSFPGYSEKVQSLQQEVGLKDAVLCGCGKIRGCRVAIAVMENAFLMGSMGQVVGEKITRTVEHATKAKLPLVIFTTSGGARMQEGIISLMQMAKVSAALKRHSNAGLLYITVLTDPTTGGVTASYAMLGDIILAEPGALIGFAGPRVIEQTIKQKLPEGFQRAEFLLEKGFVDKIVPRRYLRQVLGRILRIHAKRSNPEWMTGQMGEETVAIKRNLEEKTAWERVALARKATRPTALEYINAVFDKFVEFHGDRYFGEDAAIVGGIALLDGKPVTVIGQQKGRNTKENIKRNFGMPNPEGYRKALRLMKQAEKFHRPIICLVDTPGAFCGLGAEERGQGEAIARNLMEMADLTVPVVSIIIGEGGSGGALALAVANEVWMLENSIYSILSPEGFASILWKDSKRAKEAAEVMKITAMDLLSLGVIEKILEEPMNLEEQFPLFAASLKCELKNFIQKYQEYSKKEIAELRYEKFRKVYE